ncbi:3-dehydroquinate synthase [Patescibacteria group bacterium]|nr:3-dehydroquinate synthase [Patescibacteria group bacterium]
MPKIAVKLANGPSRSYDIIIENGLARKIPAILKKQAYGQKYAIISDATVAKLYGGRLLKDLERSGIKAHLISFSAGDKHKSLETCAKILNQLLSKNFDRKDAIIAFGGGVTGDLAGLCASIFKRGIPYIQVPTTLLAMTDSGIGGKTGVNLGAGKNLAGTIYQPRAVLIDPGFLKTLPERELLCGMSEVVKYGIIKSPNLFETIEKNGKKLNSVLMNKIIMQSCRIKADIIGKDEFEKGPRMILNYGHTIGHAIEKLSDYKIAHGQAIAAGMKLVNNMSLNHNLINKSDHLRINNLIKKLNLALIKGKSLLIPKNADMLWKIMQSDKKNNDGKVRFVIVPKIGTTKFYDKFTKKDLISALKHYD